MAHGVVVRFDEVKGYGFIAPDDGGDDVFIHANELTDRAASLVCGTRVEFDVVDGGRGLKAYDVRVIDGPNAGSSANSVGISPGGAASSGAAAASAAHKPTTAPAQPATTATADSDTVNIADDTCEVFSQDEFSRLATEMLLTNAPDLTARQVLEVREAMVKFASTHGWVD
jgi:cold shock protein